MVNCWDGSPFLPSQAFFHRPLSSPITPLISYGYKNGQRLHGGRRVQNASHVGGSQNFPPKQAAGGSALTERAAVAVIVWGQRLLERRPAADAPAAGEKER